MHKPRLQPPRIHPNAIMTDTAAAEQNRPHCPHPVECRSENKQRHPNWLNGGDVDIGSGRYLASEVLEV